MSSISSNIAPSLRQKAAAIQTLFMGGTEDDLKRLFLAFATEVPGYKESVITRDSLIKKIIKRANETRDGSDSFRKRIENPDKAYLDGGDLNHMIDFYGTGFGTYETGTLRKELIASQDSLLINYYLTIGGKKTRIFVDDCIASKSETQCIEPKYRPSHISADMYAANLMKAMGSSDVVTWQQFKAYMKDLPGPYQLG